MSFYCQITGMKPISGNHISHSHRRTKRKFNPNIKKKTYWVPYLRKNITLYISTKGIKLIDLVGINSVVARIYKKNNIKY